MIIEVCFKNEKKEEQTIGFYDCKSIRLVNDAIQIEGNSIYSFSRDDHLFYLYESGHIHAIIF